MERGQLGIENRQVTIFVFEGLVGHLRRPRVEQLNLKLGRWQAAVEAWDLDLAVCDHMASLVAMNVPVDVITWRPSGFAHNLLNHLWDHEVPVRDVRIGSYRALSQHIATDREVTIVYDPDPAHRSGYGWKARQWFA